MPTHPDALIELFPDVFWRQGTVRMGPGVTINRNMVVLRHEGDLTIIHAIRPQDPGVFEPLGRVRHVVRTGVHGMDDDWYREQFGVTHWSLPGLCSSDRDLTQHTPIPWMRVVPFTHTVNPEAVLLLDRNDGILVSCDSLQHWPDTANCSLAGKGIAHAMGFLRRPVVIGPPWHKRMTPSGGTLAPDFERIAALPFAHLIGAHGRPLLHTAKQALEDTVAAAFPKA